MVEDLCWCAAPHVITIVDLMLIERSLVSQISLEQSMQVRETKIEHLFSSVESCHSYIVRIMHPILVMTILTYQVQPPHSPQERPLDLIVLSGAHNKS